MSATTNRRGTGEIVNAIVALVSALVMPGQDDPDVKAFEKVVLFDTQDLAEAFQFLTLVEQRVCLVVPLDEQFEESLPAIGGVALKYLWKRRLPVVVICSDRVLGDRTAAWWGSDSEEGAYALAESVLPAVTGQLLPNQAGPAGGSGVLCAPKSISKALVKSDDKDLTGRAAAMVELECTGGVLEARLEKGPIF